MKKTIVAVMVAASAVLSAQAMATNTAQVTVLGEVSMMQLRKVRISRSFLPKLTR